MASARRGAHLTVTTISISEDYDVTPAELWAELRHIERHVQWMHDAVAIHFEGDQREGVGTSFVCATKVGPFVTNDVMTITEWVDNSLMGVEHRGLVRGVGVFRILDSSKGSTLTWSETLYFPWWMGGAFGALAASPILRALWRRNLRTLRRVASR